MPYKREWVPAEVFLEHSGVTIYRAYNDGDFDEPLSYWFAMDQYGEANFDVRDLDVPSGRLLRTDEVDFEDVLRDAIDAGLLRNKE